METIASALALFGTSRRVSRNQPCPCGSGRKFKRCCATNDAETPERCPIKTSSGNSWPPPTAPRMPRFHAGGCRRAGHRRLAALLILRPQLRESPAATRSANLQLMSAHKLKVIIPDTHQVVVRLPDDFPSGEAEITVISRAVADASSIDDFAWLKSWSASLPPAPTIPLEAVDRSELYR